MRLATVAKAATRLAKITVVVAAMIAPILTAAAQRTILYASFTAPTSSLNVGGALPWLNKAAELSHGSLGYELDAGGVLAKGSTVLSCIRDGVVDGGNIPSLYYPAELPINTSVVTALAFLGTDPRVTVGALAELTLLRCPRCLNEYVEQWNIVPVGSYASDPYALLCTKPVKTLSDLAGVRVRAAGVHTRYSEYLGMVPTHVTLAEVYESLQRGVMDCTFSGFGAMQTLSLGDVARYVIEFPNGSSFAQANLALNRDFWRGLTNEQRQALIDAAPAGVAGVAYDYLRSVEWVKQNAEAEGWTIYQPGPALQAKIDDYRRMSVEDVIATAKRRGVHNPEEIVEQFQQLMAKWRAIVEQLPEGPDGRTELEKALMTEVYSKFPEIR